MTGRREGREKRGRTNTVSLKPNGCNEAWDEFRSGTKRRERKRGGRNHDILDLPFSRARVLFVF